MVIIRILWGGSDLRDDVWDSVRYVEGYEGGWLGWKDGGTEESVVDEGAEGGEGASAWVVWVHSLLVCVRRLVGNNQ